MLVVYIGISNRAKQTSSYNKIFYNGFEYIKQTLIKNGSQNYLEDEQN